MIESRPSCAPFALSPLPNVALSLRETPTSPPEEKPRLSRPKERKPRNPFVERAVAVSPAKLCTPPDETPQPPLSGGYIGGWGGYASVYSLPRLEEKLAQLQNELSELTQLWSSAVKDRLCARRIRRKQIGKRDKRTNQPFDEVAQFRMSCCFDECLVALYSPCLPP